MYHSDHEIELLIIAFQSKKLLKENWTHEAHLSVGVWYLYHYEFEDAICRIKSDIMNYNVAVGVPNTGQSGYHETLTVFWMEVIRRFLQESQHQELYQLCNDFLKAPWSDKNLPFSCMDKKKLMSPILRARFDPSILETLLL